MTQPIPDLAGLAESGPVGRPTSPVAGASDKNHGPRVENAPAALHDGPAAHVGLADVPLSLREFATVEKKCSQCGQVKPLTEFSKDSGKKNGRRSECKQCGSMRQKERLAANPEKRRASWRAWYWKDPVRGCERVKAAYRKDPKKVIARAKTYYQANLDQERQKDRAYREANRELLRQRDRIRKETKREAINARTRELRRLIPEKAEKDRARSRAWQKAHPDKFRVISKTAFHARRARERNAPGRFSYQEWESLKVQYDYTCLCCGRQEPEVKLTPDHVIPLARGGSNGIENIQPLCLRCNSRKQARTIDYRPETRAESEAQ